MAEETEIILKGRFENGKLLIDTTAKIDKNLNSIGESSVKSEKQVSNFASSLKKLATIVGISFLVNQFKKLTIGVLQAAGAMEQVDVALTTMIGSASAAAKLQKDLIVFAKKTPFEIEGIFQSTKQLLAYGVAQEDIISTMSTLGNIAAGVGVDMNRLALVFGQVKTTGKLMGQDLNQFTQAGVPLLDALANTLGTTTANIVKMKESGQISFDDVKLALESLTKEGGQFFNLMENQSKTFLGSVSNMADGFFQVKVAIGEALLPVAKKSIAEMSKGMEDLLNWINENQKGIELFATAFVTSFIAIGTAFKNAFVIIFASFKGLFSIFDGFGFRLAQMSTQFSIWALQLELKLNNLRLKFAEFVSSVLDQMARLSNIPGFGFTQTLADNFTATKDSIINDIAQIEEAIIAMNDALNTRQEEQTAIELEKRQAKADSKLAIEQEELTQSATIKATEAAKQTKIEATITKFEKLQEDKRYKGAAQAADALVGLQNSKNKELAAIGKAAAIFQITNDSATGAMSAYKGMVAAIPGPVGVSLGIAAAAAIIAYGAEQITTVTSNSYAVGTANIPVDQIAQVHQGEMIVPASFSDSIRSGELSLSGGSADSGSSSGSTNIILNFDGANFIGKFNDDDIAQIGDRLGQMINENLITPLPTRVA